LKSQKLKPGDTIRLVSPASTPDRDHVTNVITHLEKWGLNVEIGKHAFDKHGFFAGTDSDRLRDINEAINDQSVHAIMATRGGKGAYRITSGLDVDAMRNNPKLLIGFSEITILQLALYKECGLASLHSASWVEPFSKVSMGSLRKALFTTDSVTITTKPNESTSSLTTKGIAQGVLIGGNQDMVAISNGWSLPSLDGAILLLEAVDLRLGHIDRQLTMLMESGRLRGVRGVAIGQYRKCGSTDTSPTKWTEIDILRERLGKLKVPILGGLPIGHGADPVAVPVGVNAVLNADTSTLTTESAVA